MKGLVPRPELALEAEFPKPISVPLSEAYPLITGYEAVMLD